MTMAKRKRKQIRNLPKRPTFSVWFDACCFENIELSNLHQLDFDGRWFEVLDYQLVDDYVVFDLGALLRKDKVYRRLPEACYDWLREYDDAL